MEKNKRSIAKATEEKHNTHFTDYSIDNDMERDQNHVSFIKSRSIIYYILGVIEILLTFRMVFKLLGARTGNAFVNFLYSVTDVLIVPFSGIFRTLVSGANTTKFIFEPSTAIAMIVYAVIARGIINLLRIRVTGKV